MKYIFNFLALFIFTIVSAKNYDFTMLATKGEVFVVKGTDTSAAGAGTHVYKGNLIILSDDSYCGLMHKSGKTLEIKSEGNYEIIDLEKKLSSSKSSFMDKYAKFALKVSNEDDTKYNYNVTASVERAIVDDYNIIAPKDGVVVVKQLPLDIHWNSLNGNEEGISLEFFDLYSNKLHSVSVDSTALRFDATEWDSADEQVIINLIDSDDHVSNGVLITVVDCKEGFMEEYEEFVSEVDTSTAMGSAMLGIFFHEKGMKAYALSQFYKVYQENKDIEYFEKLYKKALFSY